jgi:hypothetical protein
MAVELYYSGFQHTVEFQAMKELIDWLKKGVKCAMHHHFLWGTKDHLASGL